MRAAAVGGHHRRLGDRFFDVDDDDAAAGVPVAGKCGPSVGCERRRREEVVGQCERNPAGAARIQERAHQEERHHR